VRITENEGVTVKSNSLFSSEAFSKTAPKRLKMHTGNSDFTRMLYVVSFGGIADSGRDFSTIPVATAVEKEPLPGYE